jgi:hypothetical protein
MAYDTTMDRFEREWAMRYQGTRHYMVFIRWKTNPRYARLSTERTYSVSSKSRAEAILKSHEDLVSEIKIRPFTTDEQEEYDKAAKEEWVREQSENYYEGTFPECSYLDQRGGE